MPKKPVLNQEHTLKNLLERLSQVGPTKAKDLCHFLQISQPAFSRLIKKAKDAVVRFGQGQQTFYARPRSSPWGELEIPVFVISEKGELQHVATLHLLSPQGYYLESHAKIFTSQSYKSLPYFFEDLRPAGFLGRLVPRLYPELNLPEDIALWRDDDCLHYLTNYGFDLIGNFILGEKAYDLYLQNQITRLDVIAESTRAEHYPRIAELVLSQGIPGSSAGGEQPKFLSIRNKQSGQLPVLVKFSPPLSDSLGLRVADLLICEHIAHDVLKKQGKTAPQSELVEGADRLFLEIVRFDRNHQRGRYGIVSLRALDLEFVGELKSWSETAKSLLQQKKITTTDFQNIVWLEVFGKLIGNSDRHHGNISFFCEGENIIELAPVYDMLPMLYAPQQNQLIHRDFNPAPPKSSELFVWREALAAARDFWMRVAKHPRVSRSFKDLTADNAAKLSALETQIFNY